VDRLRKRVTVTHKKSLVKSDLTVVSSSKSAIVGTRCHGVVTGVEPYGVFVSLFGEARGLAGLQDLGLTVNQVRVARFPNPDTQLTAPLWLH